LGLIGLISDTHGLVRPSVFRALDGVELILHAGDVGEGVLEELRTIAPVRAVMGNTDAGEVVGLEPSIELEYEGTRIHVSHGHELGSPKPATLLARYSADVIVFGHTHTPLVVQLQGRWVVNPGAAGPRRFELKPSVGRMQVERSQVTIEIVNLE
jgi:putative phosphoesterase